MTAAREAETGGTSTGDVSAWRDAVTATEAMSSHAPTSIRTPAWNFNTQALEVDAIYSLGGYDMAAVLGDPDLKASLADRLTALVEQSVSLDNWAKRNC